MRHDGSGRRHGSWLHPASIILAALIVAAALLLDGVGDDETGWEIVPVSGLLPEGVPFTPAVRAGDLIFLSGQVGIEPGTLELVKGGVKSQARQTMENVGRVLEAAGAGFEDLVKCTVFLADIEDWPAFNEIYRGYFAAEPPARSAFAATGLALGAAVELDCIALDPEGD